MWEVYKRGTVYRVGKKRWWGIKWAKQSGMLDDYVAQFSLRIAAESFRDRLNHEQGAQTEYMCDKWHVVQGKEE